MSVIVAVFATLLAAIFAIRSRFEYLRLPELPLAAAGAISDITIIIPARNEESNIARAVASFPGHSVIVVNDASTDRTAELAQAAGARVIAAPPLARNRLGKPNACQAGASAAHSKWILFVDADTWYQPQFLPSLLDYAHENQLQLASAFLRQDCRSLAERVLLPYAFALYFCGVSSRRVNNPASRESLANGQCLLFRRDAYEFLGGHAAVADSVIEDVALARKAKRHHMRGAVLRAETLGSVRMYDSFGAIWRGFQKNSFRFLLVNPWTGAQVVAASIVFTSYLPILLWLLATHHAPTAIAYAGTPALLLFPWYRPRIAALLAPLAIYGFQLIALNGMISTLFGIRSTWKGRNV